MIKAKAKQSAHPHTFSVNFFGTLGYVGMVCVWLFAIVALIILTVRLPIAVVTEMVSPIVPVPVVAGVGTTAAEPITNYPAVRFVLTILLLVVTWVFCFIAGKALSRIVKRLIRSRSRKLTLYRFAMIKCCLVTLGLVVLITVLLFFPPMQSVVRFVLASLGFAAGITSLVALWVQHTLAERYKVPLDVVV